VSSYGGMLTLVGWLASGVVQAALPLATEFDIPYQVRVNSDGTVLEVSGSFSWALPQNIQAILAANPQIHVVHLESPGGHVLPAVQLATIIQQHKLETYVSRLCASACTVAFLGGQQRWLGPVARLGFHQAYAPGFPADRANALLQSAYETFAVPSSFIAHVLRTPHTEIWYPTQNELRAVHYFTGSPPASLLALVSSPLPRLGDSTQSLRTAPDDAVVQFGRALSDLVARLQESNPEACWAFAHEGPNDPQNALPQILLDALVAARERLAESAKASLVQTSAGEQRKEALADLQTLMRSIGPTVSLEGLRPGAEHAAFCPSLHALLEAALRLSDPRRGPVLRTMLSSG
jgi:hypothetical protein